jgi:pyruvate dehydrogenase E1 component alpha subunit
MDAISKEVKIQLFNNLLKSRRVEERLIELSTSGRLPGWLHSVLGAEAVGVGVASNLKKTDIMNNHHRGRATLIAKGVPLEHFFAEALGTKCGPCHGIAGEMHFCDMEYGIMGMSGLVSATLPIAAGMAYAAQYNNTGQVIVHLIGDGTVDNGYFHEVMNIASKWKLPIVFVVENNGWAQFVPQSATASQPEIWRKAEAYNIPSKMADGNDVLEVYATAKEAIEHARRGEGPMLVEYRVNRWLGHYVGDPQKYRDPKDIERARKSDPVIEYQALLLEKKIITATYIEKLEQSIKAEIEAALEYADKCPPTTADQAFENVYA